MPSIGSFPGRLLGFGANTTSTSFPNRTYSRVLFSAFVVLDLRLVWASDIVAPLDIVAGESQLCPRLHANTESKLPVILQPLVAITHSQLSWSTPTLMCAYSLRFMLEKDSRRSPRSRDSLPCHSFYLATSAACGDLASGAASCRSAPLAINSLQPLHPLCPARTPSGPKRRMRTAPLFRYLVEMPQLLQQQPAK